jgi:hypothetical protein
VRIQCGGGDLVQLPDLGDGFEFLLGDGARNSGVSF